jgi:hypothetical protein
MCGSFNAIGALVPGGREGTGTLTNYRNYSPENMTIIKERQSFEPGPPQSRGFVIFVSS